jgi:hypothetical protein
MKPARIGETAVALSKPGSVHLVYALKEGPIQLQLEGDRDYTVEAIDTWNMTVQPLDAAKPGEFKIDAPRADYLLRLTAVK